MEGLLWIIAIIVLFVGPMRVIRWLTGLGASAVAPDSKIAGTLNPQTLRVSMTKDKADFGGETFDCFKIKIRGTISAPYAGFPYQIVVHFLDVTDGEDKPVLCAIDQLQEAETIAFEFRTETIELPYAESVMAEWVPVATIPCDVLTMARSGQRRLRCRLDLVSASNPPFYVVGTLVHSSPGSILETASQTIDVVMPEAGYEDVKDNRQKLDGLTVKLAMAVSASDGSMDPSEGEVIRQWLTKQIAHLSDGETKKDEKRRLNSQVADAYKAANDNLLDIPALCKEVKKIGTTGDCYDIVELCFHVAAADGEAQGAELQMTRGIANFLGVSLERLRSMEEKIVPVSIHTVEQDAESLLGITPDMSPEQVRKHLNQEYRKWNSRSTHNDVSVREQATQMLKIIAECRRKYVA
jgi:tellurite resistance protein